MTYQVKYLEFIYGNSILHPETIKSIYVTFMHVTCKQQVIMLSDDGNSGNEFTEVRSDNVTKCIWRPHLAVMTGCC